jgi:hypothetical protein
MAAGYAPFNPMLSCFAESNDPHVAAGFPHEVWMELDLSWVSVAQVVVRLPGESAGADEECAFAKSNGIPVFNSVAALIQALPAV